MVSCTITEDVVINEDGAINYVQRIDIPQMAALMNSADIDEKIEMNQISNTEYTYLEFYKILKEKGGEKAGQVFSDFSKYENQLKAVDFIKMRFDLRDNFAIEIINRANSVDEFNSNSLILEKTFSDIKNQYEIDREAEKAAELASAKKKKKKKKKDDIEEVEPKMESPFSNFSSMKYSYDGKSFSKSIDAEKFLEDYNTDDLETDEEKNIYYGMLKQFKFKYKYTFPRRIKNLSIEDAMLTKDGKSFVKEFSIEELIKNPTFGNFTVELED